MKILKYITALILIIVIFYFIGDNLYSNWNQLSGLDLKWNYSFIVISLLTLMVAWLATVYGFKLLFAEFGYNVSFKKVYVIYFRSIGGKYLPGKFWQLAGSTYFASKAGIPEGISFTTFLVGQVYSVLAALIMFGSMLLAGSFDFPLEISDQMKWFGISIVIILLVFALRPALIEKSLNTLLKYFKREEVRLNISMIKALFFTLYFGVCWFIFGLAFWFLANALIYIPFSDSLGLTIIIATSVVIGFLAVITPGGIGVREGVMIVLLASYGGYQNPLPAALALGFRLLITISEIVSSIPAWFDKSKN